MWSGYGFILHSNLFASETFLDMPSFLGENPFHIEYIHQKMDQVIFRNPATKAAIDIACYDLMGKATNQPVYNLLGPSVVCPKVLCYLHFHFCPFAYISRCVDRNDFQSGAGFLYFYFDRKSCIFSCLRFP
jgi:L-alanine-DL-glutamate epimerase-like enolase superfamily enzyme